MTQKFDRKIFTFGLLHKDMGYLLYKFPTIVGALRDKKSVKLLWKK